MQPNQPNDPLLLQVLPTAQESIVTPGFEQDPLQETQYLKAPGLIHKYHGRALLTLTGVCAIHCRYCFRQHFDYQTQQGQAHQRAVLDYLQANTTLEEIILSGGDPLSLHDDKLISWLNALAEIPHLKRIRIHTRLPVVIPSRITAQLCQALASCRLQCIMVLHINHPNELTDIMRPCLQKLQQHRITLFNQSVLLKGINDCVTTLQNLSERMLDMGIVPYYLHQLDPVQGGSHFLVEKTKAHHIMTTWLATAPGYMVPRWVCDTPHQPYKTPLPL